METLSAVNLKTRMAKMKRIAARRHTVVDPNDRITTWTEVLEFSV